MFKKSTTGQNACIQTFAASHPISAAVHVLAADGFQLWIKSVKWHCTPHTIVKWIEVW